MYSCIYTDKSQFRLDPNSTLLEAIDISRAYEALQVRSFTSKVIINYYLFARSLKRYFLMEQGDFIVQLLDLCEEELLKPISDVVPSRLQSLFELALRTSTGKHDPYKEDMSLTILTRNNTHQILTIQKISGEEGETLYIFIPFTLLLLVILVI